MLTVDFFILEQIVAELAPQISGASVAKVHQPADDCLILRLWNGRQNLKLLIQVGPGARLHLTEQHFPNPFHPPRFSQLLRSRLKRLESIMLPGTERVVELLFSGADQRYRLVCELIGARSNLYLLDEAGMLLDALHKPQPAGERILRRGGPYLPLPRQERLSLADPDLAPPPEILDADQFERWLLQQVAPMSKGQAALLKKAVELGRDKTALLRDFQQAWLAQDARAALVDCGGKKQLTAYLPEGLEALKTPAASLCQFLDHCFAPAEDRSTEIGERARFRQIIKVQISRLRKRLQNIAAQQEQAASFDERRQQGDLLLANLHLIKRGMSEVVLTDWGTDPPSQIIIKLQKELSPQENAERLFKRYKKEKRGVEHVDRRRQETLEELQWLEALLLALDEAVATEELNEIGLELLTAGLIKAKKGEPAGRRRPSATPRLNQTQSPNGLRIFWGSNNRSNDHLSAQMTDGDDLWFHAHNMPGCHLVLKRDGRSADFADEDIHFAARIAAGYSRGKDDARVEVIVTAGRNVSRPKGARPGLVTLGEYRSILVAPLRITEVEKPSNR